MAGSDIFLCQCDTGARTQHHQKQPPNLSSLTFLGFFLYQNPFSPARILLLLPVKCSQDSQFIHFPLKSSNDVRLDYTGKRDAEGSPDGILVL